MRLHKVFASVTSLCHNATIPGVNNSLNHFERLSHRNGSGSGTGSVLESGNLGAFLRTGPRSHQFKRNQSGRTLPPSTVLSESSTQSVFLGFSFKYMK